jgi:glycosyltransferase involved in cell wall biosynthesis
VKKNLLKKMQISICICTKNRISGLKNLLESINEINIPFDSTVKIIVVENDKISKSDLTVRDFSKNSKFPISYFLESNLGIAKARNRSIKESEETDFCCFVDDDQVVTKDWLIELVTCQKMFGCDGVSGPNPPIFKEVVPPYIKQFHEPFLYNYGAIVKMAATNCLLLRKSRLDEINGPFDDRFDFSGGEDIFLTSQITKNGGIIRYNPNAIAYEIVPKDRTTIKYVAKRTFRNSNTFYFFKYISNQDRNRFKAIFEIGKKLGIGIITFLPFLLFSKSNPLKGLVNISGALGGLVFVLGGQSKFYK